MPGGRPKGSKNRKGHKAGGDRKGIEYITMTKNKNLKQYQHGIKEEK